MTSRLTDCDPALLVD